MIKLFLSDVDGTLTNGMFHMGEDGSLSKDFSSRDFHGLWILSQRDVQVGIISCSGDNVINEQCDRAAKYADLWTGVKDKVELVTQKYIQPGRVTWDQIAFIGDDVFDIALLKKVGMASCPNDAHPEVIASIDGYVSKFNGGYGAVRDFADYIRFIEEKNEN